ncbi:arp6 actin-related protein 6 homolog [Lichtheimia corymbifera JMRC:FSU:9682]|uniref:Actin-like protein ARP6 n=1 Tax=Lichtheimia corymbifera JMRC:FSU:9682 TaxID=1263082 RepID=A0A068RRA9_9FUNG|nr:arp6 actin-related protein 6 homolog [Lichtheimia corymbifera JMRC:FSU:9682]
MPPVVVLDNGGSTIKINTAHDTEPRLVPNAIIRGRSDRRNFIGDQIEQCTDFSSLYYRLPFERGYLTNWGVERPIWNRLFGSVLNIDPKDSGILITEPCFNLSNIQEVYDQVIFEDYEFASCYRTTAPQLCIYNDISSIFGDRPGSIPDCALVVDSGFSFTHIVPFWKGKPVRRAIRRINVGGKLLTNQLKETVSFRYYDMMEETHIINQVKEECCYVSLDVYKDLDTCRQPYHANDVVQEYVLPDYINTMRGHVRPKQARQSSTLKKGASSEQILTMNNERFMIPELLMHPSDIGIQQAGIPEAITQSVNACDAELHGLLYANIILVGGNTNIPGYRERIMQDLRTMAPSTYELRIAQPENPVEYAWHGGQNFVALSSRSDLQRTFVSRKEYFEYGSEICRRKFA